MLAISQDEVWQFVCSRYPGALGAYLYGSTQTGLAGPTSDIDLLVLLPSPSSSFRETLVHGSQTFDVFAYDPESLHGAMILERSAQSLVLVNIVKRAKVISPPNRITSAVQFAARRLDSAKLSVLELNTARHQITSLIDDLSAEPTKHSLDRLAIDLYKAIYDLALLSIGCGGFTGKHAARRLYDENPAIVEEMKLAICKALDGDTSDLLRLAKSVLKGIGGELRHGYRAPVSVPIRVPLPEESTLAA